MTEIADTSTAQLGGRLAKVLKRVARMLRGRGWYTRYPVLQAAYRRLLRLAGRQVVVVYGNSLELDEFDSCRLLVREDYEPAEARWYREVVRAGNVVVDVGAHIGVFATLFASLVGRAGTVVAVEPDPTTAALLRRNLLRNNYRDVQVHQCAASNETGTVHFYRSKSNTGDNRLLTHSEGDAMRLEVSAVRLDDLLRDLPRVDLLKLDVQGAEPQVLEGMSEILTARPPRRILSEFWPQALREDGRDPRAHLDLLVERGYRLAELDRTEERPIPVDLDELCARLEARGSDWANVIAVHFDVLEEDSG